MQGYTDKTTLLPCSRSTSQYAKPKHTELTPLINDTGKYGHMVVEVPEMDSPLQVNISRTMVKLSEANERYINHGCFAALGASTLGSITFGTALWWGMSASAATVMVTVPVLAGVAAATMAGIAATYCKKAHAASDRIDSLIEEYADATLGPVPADLLAYNCKELLKEYPLPPCDDEPEPTIITKK